MGHEEHHHEEKPLSFFASPLLEPGHEHGGHEKHAPESHTYASAHSSDIEDGKPKATDPNHVPFQNSDCELHDSPAYHRHAEATTAELFYDLFFVANLTTFTSNLEINDRDSLTAYIGFFALLWLTWYQVSLYDVRFSADSVFERIAKGIHFGVMVGFAVIGPQWKPSQEVEDYKIYRAFGLILMVSRITLALQYSLTLFYSKKYKKTILPLLMVIGSTLTAAILYGALTPAFPKTKPMLDEGGQPIPDTAIGQKSNVYIAWYIIAIMETILTVGVSMVMRVISFKGTHMVQRMSLLTLIILGEGIIVVCKSISKIVKNEFLWTAPVVGQVIAAILIIYFLYMSYFDRLHEEHFGSIKQQLWSFLHFPLHTVLVLVLQGVSILIIWRQAVEAIDGLLTDVVFVIDQNYTTAEEYAVALNETVWNHVFYYVPKGVDATKEIKAVDDALYSIVDAFNYIDEGNNQTALAQVEDGANELLSATFKTLFDSLSVSVPKPKKKAGEPDKAANFQDVANGYFDVFHLVVYYVFIAGGLALLLNAILGFLSLPSYKRNLFGYLRLAINAAAGVGLCLVTLIQYNENNLANYMASAWIIPTVCIVMFICVLVNHVRLPKRKVH